MDVQGYRVPEDLFYTEEHEWAKVEGGTVRVGITDYAAKTLNDIVYVTIPKPGGNVQQSKSMGTVESIKAVSEVYSPISGKVTKANDSLDTHPELVNKSPYGDGWLVEVEPLNLAVERTSLLDAKSYAAFLEKLLKKQ
ncbi:MAG: glycine cleavage system protein GcvH [Nitrososphaerota archaeon]|nr:glycine cleavage system protein GcvH [Nitrososphaerota archaeon]